MNSTQTRDSRLKYMREYYQKNSGRMKEQAKASYYKKLSSELTTYELFQLETFGDIAPGTSEPDESYDNEPE